jgi:hypothetical protein
MLIHLKPEEIIAAAHHAAVRQSAKAVRTELGQIKNRKISNQSDFAVNYAGLLGEYAVARSINAKVDTALMIAGDGGTDMVLNGNTIQIKTNMMPEKVLIFNQLEHFKTDWAILCSIESASAVQIHGFISKGKFVKNFYRHDWGYGNRFCVKADVLAPIEKFYEAIGLI